VAAQRVASDYSKYALWGVYALLLSIQKRYLLFWQCLLHISTPELKIEEVLQPGFSNSQNLNPESVAYSSELRRWYRCTCNAILCQAVHFPSADVQLQWEERIPLGGGPKRQHGSVQTLQQVKKMLQGVMTMLQLSVMIGPYWTAIRDCLQGCQLQPHAQSINQPIYISVFNTDQGTHQIPIRANGRCCSACTTSCYMQTKYPNRFERTEGEPLVLEMSTYAFASRHTMQRDASEQHQACMSCLQVVYCTLAVSCMHAVCHMHAVYHIYLFCRTCAVYCMHAVYHMRFVNRMHAVYCLHAVYHMHDVYQICLVSCMYAVYCMHAVYHICLVYNVDAEYCSRAVYHMRAVYHAYMLSTLYMMPTMHTCCLPYACCLPCIHAIYFIHDAYHACMLSTICVLSTMHV